MRIRKNARLLTATERDEFLAAILAIKAAPHPVYAGLSIYDYYVTLHKAATAVVRAGTATATNMAHFSDVFLPWHRELLMRFEDELRAFYPNVTILTGTGPIRAREIPCSPTTSWAPSAARRAPTSPPATSPSTPRPHCPPSGLRASRDSASGRPRHRAWLHGRRRPPQRPGLHGHGLQTAATTGVALLDTALGFDVYQGPSGFRQFFEAGGVDPDDGVNKNGPHAAFHFWFGGQSHMAIRRSPPMTRCSGCTTPMWTASGPSGNGTATRCPRITRPRRLPLFSA
jgi:hypothetical protein